MVKMKNIAIPASIGTGLGFLVTILDGRVSFVVCGVAAMSCFAWSAWEATARWRVVVAVLLVSALFAWWQFPPIVSVSPESFVLSTTNDLRTVNVTITNKTDAPVYAVQLYLTNDAKDMMPWDAMAFTLDGATRAPVLGDKGLRLHSDVFGLALSEIEFPRWNPKYWGVRRSGAALQLYELIPGEPRSITVRGTRKVPANARVVVMHYADEPAPAITQ